MVFTPKVLYAWGVSGVFVINNKVCTMKRLGEVMLGYVGLTSERLKAGFCLDKQNNLELRKGWLGYVRIR